MGTIVINQTDCKQNVVLESSLDGITGGYYDADGVWHDFASSEIPLKTYKIKKNETVQTGSNVAFAVYGYIVNYSNWAANVDYMFLYLLFTISNGGLQSRGAAIKNNGATDVYLTEQATGDFTSGVTENTRLKLYIPDDYKDIALRILEEVEE